MAVTRELAARLHKLHEAQERVETENLLAAGFAEPLGIATREWPEGLWSVRSAEAPQHPPGNQLMGAGVEHLEQLPEVAAWFAEAGTSLHLRWPAGDFEVARPHFLKLGMHLHEVEAWLAAPAAELSVPATPHDIREVASKEELDAWVRVFWEGWGIPDARMRGVAAAAMGPWPAPSGWRHYVAYVDGAPAGEALLVRMGEVAYLAEASTAPAFRRRGIQRALIARRIADARAAGASVVFAGAVYGEPSWSNMRAMGLQQASITLTFKRPAGQATASSGLAAP